MKQNILIIGASGTVGTEITGLLKQAGHNVVAATSKKAGPGQVHLNLATGEGIKAAFEGIDRAFLLSPPGYADQYKLLAPLIQEAKRRNLKKVVLMTAMGANASEDTPFRKAELDLIHSGLAYNIVRPNWFMQNFNTFWIQGIKEGKIQLPAGLAKTSFIDAQDISAVAAKLLVSDEHNGKEFDITGPRSLTHEEVAQEIQRVTGKSISYQDIPPQVLLDGLVSAGLPKDYVEFLIMIFGFLREGYNERITENVKLITGRAPRDFATYADQHKKHWL